MNKIFEQAEHCMRESLRKELPGLKPEDLEKDGTLRLSGEAYKKPKPCPDPTLTRFFTMKNLAVIVSRSIDEALYRPALAAEIGQTFEALKPLMRYCRQVML